MFKINRLHLFSLLLTAAVVAAGCKKDFINNVKPTDSALPDQVFASSASVRIYFNGIYSRLRSQWQSVESVGTTNTPTAGGQTDTWGYNSVMLTRDIKGKDIVEPYSNWYINDYINENREPTYRRVKFTWYFFYEIINQLNTLIDGTNTSATIVADEKPPLIAEARALRAYLYFELSREFCFTYLKDINGPGLPYYSKPATLDNLEGHPRGTMKELYDSINADIEAGIAGLTSDRGAVSDVSADVAQGFAARIYLEEGRWADAEAAATAAIANYALDADQYANNYNGLNSPEIIWGFPQTIENGGQSLYYGTLSSFFDYTGSGYDAFWMSKELVDHFSATDKRNTFYVYDPDPTAPDYLATNKFGTVNNLGLPPIELVSGETVDQKMMDFNESLNMMRVGEMILIIAEAQARQGKAAAAQTLFELQSNRDPSAVTSGNTGQALLDEIILERRKELYGELGIDWLDAKRLQVPLDRSGSNHPLGSDYTIPANDPRFNLKIPQAELEANTAMSASDQNP